MRNKLRVFKNKTLRKIFGPKGEEQIDGWRKLHNVELHNLYENADIIRTLKSRRFRWAVYVARMGDGRRAHKLLLENRKGSVHVVGRKLGGRITSFGI